MKKFPKRTYSNPIQFFSDIGFILRNRRKLKESRLSGFPGPAFRERLMLAVTGVNECRFCTYAHTKMALESGISQSEVKALLDGDFGNCPPEELGAVLFAQHWADTAAKPSAKMQGKFEADYGAEKSGFINLYLRMIRIGNLSGNTADKLLYYISFGKMGLDRQL
ncbi:MULTISPECIES: carboxymuconolactone decarboxylase family protein [Dehalococcoides]|jgi:AhpD family alkylhydroperoxidase|uniref:Carboxymuconolactone decarboxylase-like domain-containing protein n=2 Tax=Dehalococcoides mccartyi TaxID=61435 RepID=A0A142V856_9CHLR|nr:MULTISPECIES: carboxymuconolactone decarboxylase family protein [Dehalococcoides]AGG05809.1 hypothetical protein dcmb_176 [Dehalococcoides mccartyi DCMB5]AII60374.1 hypothetical protein X794_00725 [Dehalococcoides mccartyi CG5]AMU85948.1 hypothetical protein Dm11a5_0117 [Dehalococcoides mccartyi]AOV98822.1 hypothetical protein DCWBC2_0148 [Dehalococcoides mccartyi]AQU05285.1 carboxymuconolactone decarboxylase family protein [Dehalococcoides mccartyi]